jgi:hypothetical protein
MKKILFTLLAGLIGSISYGQTATEDGKSLIEAYIGPLGNSLGAALNNGWYNTAKPHSLGGFDFTITANIVIIPTTAKIFNISESNGSTFTGGETPTFLGSGAGSNVSYTDPVTDIETSAKAPPGVFNNFPIMPLPMVQAGVGLIKETELNFRYMPSLPIGDAGKVGLFGIGIKHDILQWLPIADKAPINLSIQAGYTKIASEVTLEDPNPSNVSPQANLGVSATTVNLILSKKLLMFTPYLGVGYNSTRTTFNVEGNYDIAGFEFDVNELTEIDFESNNNLRTNIGFRFNIALVALQANYTFSEYPTATVGIGISVR